MDTIDACNRGLLETTNALVALGFGADLGLSEPLPSVEAMKLYEQLREPTEGVE